MPRIAPRRCWFSASQDRRPFRPTLPPRGEAFVVAPAPVVSPRSPGRLDQAARTGPDAPRAVRDPEDPYASPMGRARVRPEARGRPLRCLARRSPSGARCGRRSTAAGPARGVERCGDPGPLIGFHRPSAVRPPLGARDAGGSVPVRRRLRRRRPRRGSTGRCAALVALDVAVLPGAGTRLEPERAVQPQAPTAVTCGLPSSLSVVSQVVRALCASGAGAEPSSSFSTTVLHRPAEPSRHPG